MPACDVASAPGNKKQAWDVNSGLQELVQLIGETGVHKAHTGEGLSGGAGICQLASFPTNSHWNLWALRSWRPI